MSYEEFEARIVAIAHQDLEMCAVFIVKEMIFFTIHPEPVAQGALPLVPHPAVLEQQATLPWRSTAPSTDLPAGCIECPPHASSNHRAHHIGRKRRSSGPKPPTSFPS